jgi:hypothetical protein
VHVLPGTSSARAFACVGTMAGAPTAEKDLTVESAISRYVDDLKLRGGDPANAARVVRHVPAHLMGRRVADLRKGELSGMRDGLAAHLRHRASIAHAMRSGSAQSRGRA